MPTAELLLSFALAATLIELTPGPNMAYLAILSIQHGRRAGLSAVAGIALGLLGAGLAAALGLAALIDIFPSVYNVLRWAGVVYLLWLAWEGWRGSEGSPAEAARVGWPDAVYFRRGLITNLLNPKAFLFYLAVLPRFVEPTWPLMAQTILLSLIYVAIATAIHAGIAVLAGTAQRLTSVRSGRVIRRALSLALAGVAIWLAFATAR
jgi:threonine/homoserine/homoserine lactone efflux protein